MENVKVSIICTAYNHADYIEQTLNGFLSQKFSYTYEILIHDDASTDATAEIIRKYEEKYPKIIKAVYQKENQYSKGIMATKILLDMAEGEYIALCEGDDYWNDSQKLQRQIVFLDEHPEYSASIHSGYYAYEDGIIKRKLFRTYKENRDVPIEELLSKWVCPTASIVYRRECRRQYDLGYGKNLPCGDFPLLVYLATKGKIYYIDSAMCVYRTMSKSSLSLKRKDNKELNRKMDEKFIRLLEAIDQALGKKYKEVIKKHIMQREFSRMVAEKDWKQIKKKEYQEYYLNLSWKKKLQIYLGYISPRFFGKIENKMIILRNQIEYIKDKRYNKNKSINV